MKNGKAHRSGHAEARPRVVRYVTEIIGGVNEELAQQASAFTRLLALICTLEFSIVIPYSRVNGENVITILGGRQVPRNKNLPRQVGLKIEASCISVGQKSA